MADGIACRLGGRSILESGGIGSHDTAEDDAVAVGGIFGGIGVGHETVFCIEGIAFGVLTVNHDAGSYLCACRQFAVEAHGGAVEPAAAVEGYDAAFGCGVAVAQLHGETQRACIKNFVLREAVGIDDASCRVEQGCGASAESGTYGVDVHALAVVDVEGYVVHYVVVHAFLKHGSGDGFCPDVVAEGALARSLERRAVGTVGRPVVLPGHVVLALGEKAAVDQGVDRGRCAFHDGVDGRVAGSSRGGEYEQAVVGELIGHFLVAEHQLYLFAVAQQGHVGHGNFHNFAVGSYGRIVMDGDGMVPFGARSEGQHCESVYKQSTHNLIIEEN